MSILKILFELFVLYLLYKLVFDFIIPVYRATRQVKQKVGEMQSRMNEQMKQQQANSYNPAPKESSPGPAKEDYIEFEEVK
ncbi:MAG TPA: hypothetical protein VK484_07605 [Ferruginibacter sp.]|nr:hypothetical protein [Ferruginibacter sp.]